jgi:hypothetical protein
MGGRFSVWTSSFSSFPQFLNVNATSQQVIYLSLCTQYMEHFHWWFKHLQLHFCYPMHIYFVPAREGAMSPILYLQERGQCHLFLPYRTKYKCSLRVCIDRNKLFGEVITFMFGWGFSPHLGG